MAINILLSSNNVGQYDGKDANWAGEKALFNWAIMRAASHLQNFVYSGLDISNPGAPSLNIQIAAGWAVIGGAAVNVDAAVSFSATPNITNRIWLQLSKDGNGYVTGASFTITSNDTPPSADSVLIGRAIAGASSISRIEPSVKSPSVNTGYYDGGNPPGGFYFLGATPKLVIIDENYNSGAEIIEAISGARSGADATGSYLYHSGVTTTVKPTNSNTERPEISTFGFTVGAGLNTGGHRYYWIAFF